MKCRLVQLKSSHNDVRTKEIVGHCQEGPILGFSFSMIAEPLDPAMDVRYIRTSPIKTISHHDGKILFETANSSYELYPEVDNG